MSWWGKNLERLRVLSRVRIAVSMQLVVIVGLFVIVIAWITVLMIGISRPPSELPRLGQLGDMFGIVNSLFAGMAFLAAGFASMLQYVALRDAHADRQAADHERQQEAIARKEATANQLVVALATAISTRAAISEKLQIAKSELLTLARVRAGITDYEHLSYLDASIERFQSTNQFEVVPINANRAADIRKARELLDLHEALEPMKSSESLWNGLRALITAGNDDPRIRELLNETENHINSPQRTLQHKTTRDIGTVVASPTTKRSQLQVDILEEAACLVGMFRLVGH